MFKAIKICVVGYSITGQLKYQWLLDTDLHYCLSNTSVRRIGTLPNSVLQNTKFSCPTIFLFSEVRQNIYNFSEFCWENRPISVFRHIRTPSFWVQYYQFTHPLSFNIWCDFTLGVRALSFVFELFSATLFFNGV